MGTEVAGAKLTLTGKDKEGNDIEFHISDVVLGTEAQLVSTADGNSITFISGKSDTLIKDLANGSYKLHEDAAPNGFLVASDVEFTIEDGRIISTALAQGSDDTIVMTDSRTTDVNISKVNVFGDEIAGAKLTLTGTDKEGNSIEFKLDQFISGDGAELISTEDGPKLTWLSGTSSSLIKDLTNGTYTLVEEAAPSGYMVTTEITFTVEEGTLSGGTEVTSTSVTMTDDMIVSDIEISKEDIFSEEITGAVLTLTGTDLTGRTVKFDVNNVELGEGAKAEASADGTVLTITSGSTASLIKNLTDGSYKLHESNAPNGYEVATDIDFTIVNGVLTGDEHISGNTVTMIDDLIEGIDTDVEISKHSLFGKELAGAELVLTGTDKDGKDIIFSISEVTAGNNAELITKADGNEIRWKSGDTPTMIGGLTDGHYKLHETAAPTGYEVATDIEFDITDGQVTGDVHVSGNTVTMIDEMTLTDLEVCKKNTAGDEIAGAKLTLTGKDEEGNDIIFDINNVVLGDGAELISTENTKELTWLSGTSSTFIKDLANGRYTLHEIAAPNGYEVATDITFTIENGAVIGGAEIEGTTVTMLDEMTVTTTSTTTAGTTVTTTTTTKTTATASKTDSPRTGVAGVGIPFAAVITAAGLAYAIRRKRDDE